MGIDNRGVLTHLVARKKVYVAKQPQCEGATPSGKEFPALKPPCVGLEALMYSPQGG